MICFAFTSESFKIGNENKEIKAREVHDRPSYSPAVGGRGSACWLPSSGPWSRQEALENRRPRRSWPSADCAPRRCHSVLFGPAPTSGGAASPSDPAARCRTSPHVSSRANSFSQLSLDSALTELPQVSRTNDLMTRGWRWSHRDPICRFPRGLITTG